MHHKVWAISITVKVEDGTMHHKVWEISITVKVERRYNALQSLDTPGSTIENQLIQLVVLIKLISVKSDFLLDTIKKDKNHNNSIKIIIEGHKYNVTFEFKQVDIEYAYKLLYKLNIHIKSKRL